MTNISRKHFSQKTNAGEMQYFKDILTKVGISLQFTDGPNILLKEPSLLVKRLECELEGHENYPSNIPEFISGLKQVLKSEKYMKKALSPSAADLDQTSSATRRHECLFRILLGVDPLQSEIISLLLDEVAKYALNVEDDMSCLRLILGPLRYVPYIREPDKLCKKLLDILEESTYGAQLEILFYIPEIIPDSLYEETARRLVRVLDENSHLTAAIIDCLNYLGLSPDMKEEIQDRILAIMNTATTLKVFPMVFSFLVSDCRPRNLSNVLMHTRTAVDEIIVSAEASSDSDTDQVLTFQEMYKLMNNSTSIVADGWINVISSVRVPSDHKPIDVLLLFMLHSMDGNRKHAIENIIRKKIKSHQFKLDLFEKTLKKYVVPQIFNDYLPSIISIASNLIQAIGEPLYGEFARVIYSGIFTHKNADASSRRRIVSSLLQWMGGEVRQALSVLQSLTELKGGRRLLRPHALQLMTLLDKLDTVTLAEAQQIFQLLCSLVWASEEDANVPGPLQNDIHMMVRKQLSSFERNTRYRGVLAAVAAAKHMVLIAPDRQTDDSISSDLSYSSVTDLPAGVVRQAAGLLELAFETSSACPVAQGLFYDQLANMIVSTENLNSHFMSWLVDTITGEFQTSYVTDKLPDRRADAGFSFGCQYDLNSSDAVTDTIMVNIGGLGMTGEDDTSSLVTMPSLFRLVRLLHQRLHAGNLDSIDALLGCGVILPVIDPDVALDNYSLEDAKRAVDCIYYSINWFREVINAFVNQKGQPYQKKVFQRMNDLIQLEEDLISYLNKLPGHKLPSCYFYNVNLDTTPMNLPKEGPKSDGAKRKKVNNTMADSTSKIGTQAKSPQGGDKLRKANKEVHHFSLREMDTDIILLLKYPLIFQEETNQELSLTLTQFQFIGKDLLSKLRTLSKPQNNSSLSHLGSVKPEHLVKDCVQLMMQFDSHLSRIIKELKELLDRSDGIHDSHEMFQPHAIQLKVSLALVMDVISLTLAWPGFHSPSNVTILRDCLRALVGTDVKSSQLRSAQHLSMSVTARMVSLADYCLTLQSAVSLVAIVQALCTLAMDRSTLKKKLILLSGKLLERKWFTTDGFPETGAYAANNINILVRAHLDGSDLTTVSSIVSWVQNEMAQLRTKDDHLATLQSINKANFPIMYRGLCSALHEALRTELDRGKTDDQHLDIWSSAASTLYALMYVVRVQESRSNLNSFLKKSTAVLKLFLSHGLPKFEMLLVSNSERVYEILKLIQQTTRFVHNLCCHSKVTKDRGLVSYVPQMRLTLETLVYKVKALLVANNCSSVFWMGNLKNKDLRGEEICSQSTENSVQEEEDSVGEENIPPNDSNEESDNEQSTHSGMDDSASEIF